MCDKNLMRVELYSDGIDFMGALTLGGMCKITVFCNFMAIYLGNDT